MTNGLQTIFEFMSLPIYEAVSFQKILDKVGHSKPWVVLVDISDIAFKIILFK